MADPIRRLAILHSDGSMSTLPLETTLREAAEEAASIATLEEQSTPPTISWVEMTVGDPLSTDHLLMT